MKTLLHFRDREEILNRLAGVKSDSQSRWGTMSANQMICHLSDSFRASLGEKFIKPAGTPFKRMVYKWVALWAPIRWPHGVVTRPEMDQRRGGGTRPGEFEMDREKLRNLFARFCEWDGEFEEHGTMGRLSRNERMRHAFLHMDHHLRQFGA